MYTYFSCSCTFCVKWRDYRCVYDLDPNSLHLSFSFLLLLYDPDPINQIIVLPFVAFCFLFNHDHANRDYSNNYQTAFIWVSLRVTLRIIRIQTLKLYNNSPSAFYCTENPEKLKKERIFSRWRSKHFLHDVQYWCSNMFPERYSTLIRISGYSKLWTLSRQLRHTELWLCISVRCCMLSNQCDMTWITFKCARY